MAMIEIPYRIKIDMTYTSTGNATTAVNAINAVLSTAGRAEVAVRTGSAVYLMIPNLSYATAISLRDSLNTAWAGAARTGGKVSCVRSPDLT